MPKKPRDTKKQITKTKCSPSLNKRTSKQIKFQRSLLSSSDVIPKSEQLSQKIKTVRNKGASRSRLRHLNNNEPRVCGNGKPMPSLEELEKMFDDSDNDEEKSKEDTNQEEMTCNDQTTEESPMCLTPKKETSNDMEQINIYSPKTIQAIVDRVAENINSLTENIPPPRIKPQKKRKKPLVPYIVGCENRPKVPIRPTTNFCKGDDSYGVDSNSSDDEELPTKRAKRTKTANFSKSLFNAQSDEIAAYLKEFEHSDKSTDSDKTVSYDVPCSAWPQSFSPEPSTSKCLKVIKKNEISLNESLIAAEQGNEDESKILTIGHSEENDIVTTPQFNEHKTEMLTVTNSNKTEQCNEDISVIEIIEQPNDVIVVEEYIQSKNKINNDLSNLEIQIVNNSDNDIIEVVTQKKCNSPILVDEYYSSLDLHQISDDDVAIVNIDDVIAESTAIAEKYRKTNYLNTVTVAEPSLSKNSEDIALLPKVTTADFDPAPNAIDIAIPNNHSQISNQNSECTATELNHNTAENVLRQFVTKFGKSFVQNMLDGSIVANRNVGQSQQESLQPDMSKSLGECPICMDSFSNKTVVSTICGHIFCMTCIQSSLKVNGKKCPKCRKALKKNGYHQIFL